MDLAHVRILRLAAGTASSMWFSQAVGWDMSFIAPVMTMFALTTLYGVIAVFVVDAFRPGLKAGTDTGGGQVQPIP